MNSSYTVEAVMKATGASKFQQAFANAEQSMKKFEQVGQQIGDVGKSLTKGLTLPILGIGAAATKTVMSFDDSMAGVQKISGATGKDFDNLRDKAKELGRTTAFSASEAADGMGVLAASGMETNDILAVSGDMFNLMSAGSIDADTSARILTNSMAQFNLTADDSEYIVDAFASGAASAKVSVGELEHAMALAGGSLANMNMTTEESVAVMGQLANGAVPAAQLGSTINAMSRDIIANASEMEKFTDVYDEATGEMRGMDDIMNDFTDSLKDMTDEEKNAAMAKIFTGKSQQGVNAWINEGSEGYAELTKSMEEMGHAAKIMADIQEDTVGGAFRALKSATEGLMIELGDVIKGPIQDLALKLADLATKFGKLDDSTKKTIVTIAGIVAAIGPVLLAISGLIKTLGLLLSPIGLVTAAIALITGAVVYLWKTNEDFRVAVTAIWENIKEVFSSAWEAIQEVFMSIAGPLMEWFIENQELIKETVSTIWEAIKELFTLTLGAIWEVVSKTFGNMMEFINENQEDIKNIIKIVWESIKLIVETALGLVQGIVETVMGLITGDWDRAWNGIKTIASTIWESIKKVISTIIESVRSIVSEKVEAIRTVISDKFQAAKNAAEMKFTQLKTAVTTKISEAYNNVRDYVSDIVSAFTDIDLWAAGKAVIDGFIKGMKNMWESGKKWVKGIGTWIKDNKGPIRKDRKLLTPAGNAIISGLNKGLEDSFPQVQNTVLGMAGAIQDSFASSPTIDINGDVARSNAQVKSTVSHEIADNRGTQQSAHITLNMGPTVLEGFTDDITRVQDSGVNLELSYR